MTHPYKTQPDHAFWRRAMSGIPAEALDPAIATPFCIAPQDKVVTAGSCFAQHIGGMLEVIGFTHFVAEPAHPLFRPEDSRAFGYGQFSARYGNIYTARQLLQLLRRAYGEFHPAEDCWEQDGTCIDPFRPQIQPGGFTSRQEFTLDRTRHFTAVRRLVEELDVLVFTLGLTEAWLSRKDGAAFTICPGTAGGVFNPAQHVFYNFTAQEVAADLAACIAFLRARNLKARVVLTVSPVPLVATARAETHVAAATFYSKSALRVAAEMVAQSLPDVAYFPSYEIIMSRAFDAGSYFAPDKRSITNAGVAHVMRVFASSFAGIGTTSLPLAATPSEPDTQAQIDALMQAHCDELALDQA